MAKQKSDGRDVFEKALDDDEYYLTGAEGAALLAAGVIGGIAGGGILGRRLTSKARRAAESAALKRAAKDGSLGWGKGRDRTILDRRSRRGQLGEVIGGAAGMGGAVYAGTRKKPRKKD